MKRLLSAIIFPAMFISISNVYALDIQPGEWKMENGKWKIQKCAPSIQIQKKY